MASDRTEIPRQAARILGLVGALAYAPLVAPMLFGATAQPASAQDAGQMTRIPGPARIFFFGNETIRHPSGTDTASLPYWLGRMAEAEGRPLAAEGRAYDSARWLPDLPPAPDWSWSGIERAMTDNPRSFRMAGFDTVVLTLPAGVYDPAALVTPMARGLDWIGAQIAGSGSDARPATILLIEPWPIAPANTVGAAEDLANRLRSALPEARILVAPVGPVLDWVLSAGPLANPDGSVAQMPDSTTAYLLAAMVTHSALTGRPAPLIELPASVDARLSDSWTEAATAIWQRSIGAAAPSDAHLPAPETGFSDPSIAWGLNGVEDWSSQLPFIDLMKMARPWLGHTDASWGAVSFEDLRAGGYLSPEGWPLAIPPGVNAVETLILTDLPPEAQSAAGRYVVRWSGTGTLELNGRATLVERDAQMLSFDFTPGPGLVALAITATDADDPIRDITVIRDDHQDLADAGALFNPDWLAVISDARVLRFMDWMRTNGSTQSDWDDRPLPGDFSYTWRGVPAEVMVALANHVGADPWFTLPHQADDAYVAAFAALVRDSLDLRLQVHAEWSNEVWNFIFPQAGWAAEQAALRWGASGEGGDGWMQFAGTRAAEVADIWSGIFEDTPEGRLINVVSTHTGWLGLEEALLDAPLRQAEGLPAPVQSFDAYAITGYFGHEIGSEDLAPDLRRWIADGSAAAEVTASLRDGSLRHLTDEVFPHHAGVAAARDLTLMMYEGGTHAVGQGPVVDDEEITRFLTGYSYSTEMAGLYAELIGAWRDLGEGLELDLGPFNAFVDVGVPGKWGSWGAQRWIGDLNPRAATLMAWNSVPMAASPDRTGAFDHGVIRRGIDGGAEIAGTPGADILIGGTGDDLITSGGGHDRILGGGGYDRVILPGLAADWSPGFEGEILWMFGPQNVTVRLAGISRVEFSAEPDRSLDLAPAPEGPADRP